MTLADVLAYPHQVADALWRIESAGIPRRESPAGVAVCGVAYGAGAIAAAALGDRAGARVRDGLDPGAGDDTVALCVSYSGDDEEALACFEEAGERGMRRAVVCTAGRLAARARESGVPVVGVPAGIDDPRAAIIYFVLTALIIAEPSMESEIEAAVPTLTRLAEMSPEELRAIDPDKLAEARPAAERTLARLLAEDLVSLYADDQS
jgi:glucose/mannose-6-phosphate isomerase